ATTQDEPEIEWLDWRDLPRDKWPLDSQEQYWIWDNTSSTPTLRCGNDKNVNQSLGLMLGLPLTDEDFKEGVEKLRRLGIFRIALAGFQSPLEELVHQRCCYISREELVLLYRELLAKSKTGNPIHWGVNLSITGKEKTALKIIEELGLIRCLGGTDQVILEWIPAQSKLDLDSSLRYRYAKERLDKALKFQQELLAASL
ncbi:MAG: single-stranded-DNA-specific exonuclease RecJ, partial [Firmicutes bacterium]|nr:single-stranded-DNA-specific exonuclease RecJ [Bacillota bacterium]